MQAQAISGLGGIGKTQTTIEYAYRFREQYSSVLWCRAETRSMLLADLLALADHLLDIPQKHEPERMVQAIRRWLQTSTGWLLILDNVEDLSLVAEVLPAEYSGHVLLTTRTQATGMLAQRIDLEQMEPQEGALFLLRRAKLIGPDAPLETAVAASQAKVLSQLLDGLPLALDQAGAYIEETGCSLSDYLERYQARRAFLLTWRGQLGTDHPESVATTIALSLGKVERSNPAAAELLRLCAFLDPDAIPEELLTQGASDLGPILEPAATDPLALDEVLAALRHYSLLRRHPESKTLSLHRLVQAVLKDQMNEQTQREWAERCVLVVNRTFPTHEAALWQHGPRLFPQVEAAIALITQWQLSLLEVGQLLVRAGHHLIHHGQYQAAEPLLQHALSLHEQHLESAHPAIAVCLDMLGKLYWYQGQLEQSERLRKRVLDIVEHAKGPEHPDVVQALSNLAGVYRELERYTEAEPLYLRAYSILERLVQTEPPSQTLTVDMAACAEELGVLYSLQGKFAQAEPLQLQAVILREQILGGDHPLTSYSYHNLGFLYEWQGRYAQAEAWYTRALELRESVLGPEHPSTAATLNNLARVYQMQGRYQEAEPLYHRALSIREQMLSPEHPHVARTLNGLALLFHAQGKAAEAETLLQQALAICEAALGPEHPEVAWELDALAQVYESLGRDTEAEPLAKRALRIYERRLGADHPESIMSWTILGLLCGKQGRYAEAGQYLQHALTMCEQCLGAEHPHTARTLYELGLLYQLQGQDTEAEPLFQRALAIREQRLGAEHPETVATRTTYAALLEQKKTGRDGSLSM